MLRDLIKKAIIMFPRSDYLSDAAVRHARRQWVRAALYLRNRPTGSRWANDGAVGWKIGRQS